MLIKPTYNPPTSPSALDDHHHVVVCGLGLDLVGPLKRVLGGYMHLLVAMDKFTKWIEARLISVIKFEQAMQFFLDIVHRFGVPNSIIMDNSTQFTGKKFL
jgi:hypothetical protein